MTTAEELWQRDSGMEVDYLAEIDLPDGIVRAWTGAFVLTTLDGRVWQPLSSWGRLSAVRTSAATVSEGFTVGIVNPYAGQPDAAEFAEAFRADFNAATAGRRATIYAQAFEAAQLVGMPEAIASGAMGPVSAKGSAGVASLAVSVRGLLADGPVPPHGLVSSADQEARYPGDRILKYAAGLQARAEVFEW